MAAIQGWPLSEVPLYDTINDSLLTPPLSYSHILVGSLLVKYLLTLVPTHSVSLAGVKISGNLPFYLLLALVSSIVLYDL